MTHTLPGVAALAIGIATTSAASSDRYDLDALRVAAEGMPAEMGAMGIHCPNPAVLKITATAPRVDGESTYTDFIAPAILLYEPQADGSLVLVGIENLVFETAWRAAGNDGPPYLNGRQWDHLADNAGTSLNEAYGFMPHFDQHVWLFRENPLGDREPFNPNVTCDCHAG